MVLQIDTFFIRYPEVKQRRTVIYLTGTIIINHDQHHAAKESQTTAESTGWPWGEAHNLLENEHIMPVHIHDLYYFA